MSLSGITLVLMKKLINSNDMRLISDIDASQWQLKLDYAKGTGIIIPASNQVRDYSIYPRKRFIFHFPPPRCQIMGTE